MKITYVKVDPEKLKKYSVPLSELDKQFTPQDVRAIKLYEKYYELLMKLRQARKASKLTQAELSKRSNIPRATIAKIENGQRNATIKTLLALAEGMGKELKISWV